MFLKKRSVKRKAKLGVIGCGNIVMGKNFGNLGTIAELHKGGYLELAAVCDMLEDRARTAGEMYHVPYYTDAEKMLSTDLDCVYVTVGDYLHHEVCKLAAEHGKHFTVEKPMALSLPCCDMMINAAKKAGVYYDVAENYFRLPNERVMKMAIKAGIIGDVLRVYAIQGGPPRSPRAPTMVSTQDFSSHSRALALYDGGSHQMSQLTNFAGSEPLTVKGATMENGWGWPHWGGAWVDFENKVLGINELNGGSGEVPFREVLGTKGHIYGFGFASGATAEGGGYMKVLLAGDGPGGVKEVPIVKTTHQVDGRNHLDSIVLESEPKITYRNPWADCVSTEWGVATADEIMSICNAAVNDVPPENSVGGRKSIEMTIAMVESSLTGKPVKLPITSLTSWEKRVHEAYEKQFGHSPLKV